MAVTTIPNVTNWTVTPQNGQAGYFTLMNTWLGQSTTVIASLQTVINAQNTANSEINALAIQTENNANIAASVGNYQGVWSNLVTYSKSMGVSVGNLYYISKVDSNLNHAVTDTNYWLYNPINDKLDKDFSVLADKTTPSDSDIFATIETGGLLKKISWANSKATLKTYFDTLYLALTGNQTVNGVKTFSSSPIVPTPTTSTQAANKQYADLKVALADFSGTNVKLAVNGYQKLPSGLIIQWGSVNATNTNGGYTTAFYPIRFPNNCLQVIGARDALGENAILLVGKAVGDPAGLVLAQNWGPSVEIAKYVAIGY